ncbi:MAG TPA: putative Ig domain-containing protein [Thermoanaerobaculia bacterium]|nr:putative Ig domain-containing protein [Thermoanaerobaculia bacterium]
MLGRSVSNSGATTVLAGNAGGNTVSGLSRANFVLGDVVAAGAASGDAAAALRNLDGQPCTATPSVLSGPLGPGVYCISSPAVLTGTLTLEGDRNAVWIFRTASLRTDARSSVLVSGGGRESRVFWEVDDATLGEESRFAGNLLARRSITAGARANIAGRLLAPDGAVTLNDNGVTICCDLVTLSPPLLPDGTVGVPYPATALTASGGTAPYAISRLAGALPDGLTLSPAGTLSGTPRTAGVFRAVLAATDREGFTCIRVYNVRITVGCPIIDLSPLDPPGPTTCAPYLRKITASGGTPPYRFSGVLPSGLILSPDGTISGTADLPGAYSPTVTAVDANGCTGSRTYPLIVLPEPVTLPEAIPVGIVGIDYSFVLPARAYRFDIVGLPSPLGLSGGTIGGKPEAAGVFEITITVIDTVTGCTAGSKHYDLRILDAISSLPPGKLCVPYDHTMEVAGTFASGALPPGLTLSGARISGTPTVAGTFTGTFLVSGVTVPFSLTVEPTTIVLSPETLPAAIAGSAYSQTITASGAAPPYTFTVGTLPASLSYSTTDDTVTIFGTPSVAGEFEFPVTASVSACSTARPYTLHVGSCPALLITPDALEPARVGTSYSDTLTATGGTAPYTFTVVSKSLPPGLILSLSGALSGTPTVAGVYSPTIRAMDVNGCTGDIHYCTIDVSPASCPPGTTVTLTPSQLPPAVLNAFYSEGVTAGGGTAPYVYTVVSGSLPPGLSLNPATGVISGLHTTNGAFAFTVRATDANGCIGSHCYVIRTAGNAPLLSGWGMGVMAVLMILSALLMLRGSNG